MTETLFFSLFAEAVEAGNQMLRIEQMADAMMTGQGDGFVDRFVSLLVEVVEVSNSDVEL